MKRLAITTTIVAIASLALVATGSASTKRVATDVDIIGLTTDGDATGYGRIYGTVDSSEKCEADRKITVKNDQSPGSLGKTRTDSNGFWSLHASDSEVVEGVYKATAAETGKCKKGTATKPFL